MKKKKSKQYLSKICVSKSNWQTFQLDRKCQIFLFTSSNKWIKIVGCTQLSKVAINEAYCSKLLTLCNLSSNNIFLSLLDEIGIAKILGYNRRCKNNYKRMVSELLRSSINLIRYFREHLVFKLAALPPLFNYILGKPMTVEQYVTSTMNNMREQEILDDYEPTSYVWGLKFLYEVNWMFEIQDTKPKEYFYTMLGYFYEYGDVVFMLLQGCVTNRIRSLIWPWVASLPDRRVVLINGSYIDYNLLSKIYYKKKNHACGLAKLTDLCVTSADWMTVDALLTAAKLLDRAFWRTVIASKFDFSTPINLLPPTPLDVCIIPLEEIKGFWAFWLKHCESLRTLQKYNFFPISGVDALNFLTIENENNEDG